MQSSLLSSHPTPLGLTEVIRAGWASPTGRTLETSSAGLKTHQEAPQRLAHYCQASQWISFHNTDIAVCIMGGFKVYILLLANSWKLSEVAYWCGTRLMNYFNVTLCRYLWQCISNMLDLHILTDRTLTCACCYVWTFWKTVSKLFKKKKTVCYSIWGCLQKSWNSNHSHKS